VWRNSSNLNRRNLEKENFMEAQIIAIINQQEAVLPFKEI
jgi:hypothetical protein